MFFTSEYYAPKADLKFFSSLSVVLVAYTCQYNLFSLYSELRNKTSKKLLITTMLDLRGHGLALPDTSRHQPLNVGQRDL